MIYVKKIIWLNEEAQEAEVHLSDGTYTIVCFAHPFEYSEGQEISMPLFSLNEKNVIKIEKKENLSVRLHDSFEYNFSGRVTSINPPQVTVSEFVLELFRLPGDIKLGDYVSFSCGRVDIS